MVAKIQIICGPTASGKSARALEIAQGADGVIINADAMQVYGELRILTARPTPEDEAKALHLLYGVLPAREACSAARWLALAREAIEKTWGQGKLPVVTGGTGLYLKALMDGLSPIPDIPANIRIQAQALWEEQGAEALRTHDAGMAAQLKDGDSQRHIRALSVWLATGKSLHYWQSLPREKLYRQAVFDVQYIDVPRAELYLRCDARFQTMMQAGVLEEVRALMAQELSSDLPAMRAVGVPELAGYLRGECSLEEATSQACQATRNYVKRQVTWFKNQLKAAS